MGNGLEQVPVWLAKRDGRVRHAFVENRRPGSPDRVSLCLVLELDDDQLDEGPDARCEWCRWLVGERDRPELGRPAKWDPDRVAQLLREADELHLPHVYFVENVLGVSRRMAQLLAKKAREKHGIDRTSALLPHRRTGVVFRDGSRSRRTEWRCAYCGTDWPCGKDSFADQLRDSPAFRMVEFAGS